MFKRDNSQKAVDSEWHEFRHEARTTAFDIQEFGDIDIEKYDLETARITGQENPDTYTWRRPLYPEGPFDIRKLKDR
jgi:hypothetical protein